MSKPIRMSMTTRKNWLIDASVFLGGIAAALSGVYFLFLPWGATRVDATWHMSLPSFPSRHSWSHLHASERSAP
jgi:hypothetical protein